MRRDYETEVITILVLKERQSRAIQAWAVPNRSTILEERAAAERAAEGVRFLHRDKVLLKTHNEAAILALRTLVLGKFRIPAFEVEPQHHESQSEAAVENEVKFLQGLLRVHILALERKLGHRVHSKHTHVAWLVEHVADIITKNQKELKGADVPVPPPPGMITQTRVPRHQHSQRFCAMIRPCVSGPECSGRFQGIAREAEFADTNRFEAFGVGAGAEIGTGEDTPESVPSEIRNETGPNLDKSESGKKIQILKKNKKFNLKMKKS